MIKDKWEEKVKTCKPHLEDYCTDLDIEKHNIRLKLYGINFVTIDAYTAKWMEREFEET